MRTKPQATTLRIDAVGVLPMSILAAVVLALAAVLLVAAQEPARAAFPGTNGKIVFVSDRHGNEEIYTMNPDGTVRRLTNNPAKDFEPAFSPDGAFITFTSLRDGNAEIYRMTDVGSGLTRLTFHPENDENPVFSPDGEKIAFASSRAGGTSQIYTMNASPEGPTNVPRRLTFENPVGARNPAWSLTPEGEKIAFGGSVVDGNTEIFHMNAADGSDRVRLTFNGAFDNTPNFSPDGRKIAFRRGTLLAGSSDILVTDLDGTDQTNLTDGPGESGSDPTWSPDGARIAFADDRDADDQNPFNYEIYEMNADDGSNQTRRTNNTALDWEPDWGPVVGSCTITGNNGDKVLNGTPGYDVICGLGGDDRIRGYGATDRIRGGAGNDVLYGGEGDDLVFGEENDDIVNTKDGVEGNDVAVGGSGRDSCRTDPEDLKLSCEP
jgi:Tol biopolymer transport system component